VPWRGRSSLTVADYPAVVEVQLARLQVVEHQADARLARHRPLVFEVWIDVHRAEADALRFEQVQHFLLRDLVVGRRKRVRAKAVLVADDDELVTSACQAQQGGDDAGHQFQLLQRVDLFVGWFHDQGAIAVDEQDSALTITHSRFSHSSKAAASASISSAEPTEIRR
jgi:hypothetical protein